jgi:hypothetical protein
MDAKRIKSENIVERYLAGELRVREAREFEKYCLEHPEILNDLPIPVRLKARLARQPLQDSETGVFKTIPSGATRALADAADEGFEPDEDEGRWQPDNGRARIVVIALAVALVAALGGLVAYAMRASALAEKLEAERQAVSATQMAAPGSTQTYKVQLSRTKPAQATLLLGWLKPPQLLDLYVDMAETKHTQFMVTIDKVDGGRLLQIRRIARDSNRELRLGLNSSAFGPGEITLKFDGYDWRGQLEELGWVRLGLQ